MLDIVIPFYNRKIFVKKAIRSVQNQGFKQWHLWLVDDGSADGASEELEREFVSHKIQIIRLNKNYGVSFARNQAIKMGKNPWIAFLDSDDEWLPIKLEKQMQYLQKNPSTALIHCNEIWLKNKKIFPQKNKHKKQGGRVFKQCALLCCISPSATIIKRSVIEDLNLFREDFPVCEDYEMWLRLSAQYEVAFLEESLLFKHGGHPDQLSYAYPVMDYWRAKALSQHVNSKYLSQEEKEHLKKVLLEKCNILLKGYEKHKNFKHKKEIESYKKKVANN